MPEPAADQDQGALPFFPPEAGAVGSDDGDVGSDGDASGIELAGELSFGVFLDDEGELLGLVSAYLPWRTSA